MKAAGHDEADIAASQNERPFSWKKAVDIYELLGKTCGKNTRGS